MITLLQKESQQTSGLSTKSEKPLHYKFIKPYKYPIFPSKRKIIKYTFSYTFNKAALTFHYYIHFITFYTH